MGNRHTSNFFRISKIHLKPYRNFPINTRNRCASNLFQSLPRSSPVRATRPRWPATTCCCPAKPRATRSPTCTGVGETRWVRCSKDLRYMYLSTVIKNFYCCDYQICSACHAEISFSLPQGKLCLYCSKKNIYYMSGVYCNTGFIVLKASCVVY